MKRGLLLIWESETLARDGVVNVLLWHLIVDAGKRVYVLRCFLLSNATNTEMSYLAITFGLFNVVTRDTSKGILPTFWQFTIVYHRTFAYSITVIR